MDSVRGEEGTDKKCPKVFVIVKRQPPGAKQGRSSAASDVYEIQGCF